MKTENEDQNWSIEINVSDIIEFVKDTISQISNKYDKQSSIDDAELKRNIKALIKRRLVTQIKYELTGMSDVELVQLIQLQNLRADVIEFISSKVDNMDISELKNMLDLIKEILE